MVVFGAGGGVLVGTSVSNVGVPVIDVVVVAVVVLLL